MRSQKKGPAEAATSPSHGSNKSTEGNAVNRQHDTTASAVPATFDPLAYAERLYDLRMLARSAVMMVDAAFTDALDHQGLVAITQYEADLISFIVSHVRQMAEVADTVFDASSFAASLDVSPTLTPAPSMRASIERHRVLFHGLARLYQVEDEARGNGSTPAGMALQAAEVQESEAKTALLRTPPANLEDEADRLEYLFGFAGPWHSSMPTVEERTDLIASLRAA